MCGIFAVSTESEFSELPDLVPLEKALTDLTALDPYEAGQEKTFAALSQARKHCGIWIRPEGFLSAAEGISPPSILKGRLDELEAWISRIDSRLEDKSVSLGRRERILQLLTGARDTAWQLRRDLLENIPKVRSLLGGRDEGGRRTRLHGWTLNLVLNSIDRLEVRGRDSAGLAVYLRFPSKSELEGFLVGERGSEFGRRRGTPAFSHGGVLRPALAPDTLLFAFKVAQEVGEMGQNVRFLRNAIAADRLFQAALRHPGCELQVMGHTRWASNGIISIPNTHPVDSAVIEPKADKPFSQGSLVAALNGDIDNFQELYKKYLGERGASVEADITTDAKIIPIVVQEHLKDSATLEEAFSKAFQEFDGSMAICLMAADRPGEFICAQKGGGQGLFLGFAGSTTAVASEMYGLVELTESYVKAEGERVQGGRTVGETFLIRPPSQGGTVLLPGGSSLNTGRIRTAEITTRDIDRGEFPRFLLKEITESVRSVERTLLGKIALDEERGTAETLLDESVIPASLSDDLASGKIRKIITTGQGTAAIAGAGIAYLMERALRGTQIDVSCLKATELSSHYLVDDMSDCLIIAVSQSGTTTDTNRTVDLVRERGGRVIGVVNRRNSDLVYKSDGVLYTSDGRDIEMSVASTKAFYAQNVAGEILALAVAERVGVITPPDLFTRIRALRDLPEAMRRMLALSDRIAEVAAATAVRKRYWAIVGTGAGKIAADEIRIKLSELCYKAIAVDYLEDKKHIDLSSEPLILVCASGLPEVAVTDTVKEVAIFKAHSSVPVVFAEEGERRFDPYAAHLIEVPRYEGPLSYLLPTMGGHLFGYHAARAFDRQADRIKELRLSLVEQLQEAGPVLRETAVWHLLGRAPKVATGAVALQGEISSGSLDSGLEVRTAGKLTSLLDFLLGNMDLDHFRPRFDRPGTVGSLLDSAIEALTDAVNEVCRPIDAIKHQAKTVTVGISRQIERPTEGVLWSVFQDLEIDPTLVSAGHTNFLSALEPIVARVDGTTLYSVEGLNPVGKPLHSTRIRTIRKSGSAETMTSRCDRGTKLSGTKWGVTADNKVYLGRGQNDARPICILPVIGQKDSGHILLFHLELMDKGARADRVAALQTLPERYKQVLIAVTEATSRDWDPAFVDAVSNEQLFFEPPAELGKLMARAV